MSKVMGQRIHDKRIDARLTLEELGNRLGVSKQTISKWEQGKVKNIDRDYIGKMAAIFHCDANWLMHMENAPKVTVTYTAEGRTPVTAVVNNEPIMGPASLRAQLYKVALDVKPENLPIAIELLKSLSGGDNGPKGIPDAKNDGQNTGYC